MVIGSEQNYEGAYRKWGRTCSICGSSLGMQIHHIDGDHGNPNLQNLMPLCGSCHQEVTQGKYVINVETREVSVGLSPYFRLATDATQPGPKVFVQVEAFYRQFQDVPERENSAKLTLYQDRVSGVSFVDCHLVGDDIASLTDPRTRLRIISPEIASLDELETTGITDAEEAEEEEEAYADLGFNRGIQETHPVFRRMTEDAKNGRSFLGIVLEWDQSYTPEIPLKILGGQHRCEAIRRAVEEGQEGARTHSVRIYFGLTAEQQAEIIDIYNANIDIPKALWDRIGEQFLGDASRRWCERVGLLAPGENFTDKPSQDRPFTVQIARCLVVNFFRGRNFAGQIEGDDAAFFQDVDIVPTGSMDAPEEYKRLISNPSTLNDPEFERAGQELARLHNRQKQTCTSTAGLRAYQNKALTPAIVAGWAFAAGVLSRDPARQALLFRLGTDHDKRVSPDPLNGRLMSEYHHPNDKATYRGLGTRQNKAEAQKLAYLFLTHSNPVMTRTAIQKQLCDYAVGEYYRLLGRLKQQDEERKQAELRARLQRTTDTS